MTRGVGSISLALLHLAQIAALAACRVNDGGLPPPRDPGRGESAPRVKPGSDGPMAPRPRPSGSAPGTKQRNGQPATRAARGRPPVGNNLSVCKAMAPMTRMKWAARHMHNLEEVAGVVLESVRKGRPQDLVNLLPLHLRSKKCASAIGLPTASPSRLCEEALKAIETCWSLIDWRSLKIITTKERLQKTRMCGGRVSSFSPAFHFFSSGGNGIVLEVHSIFTGSAFGIRSIPTCRRFRGSVEEIQKLKP